MKHKTSAIVKVDLQMTTALKRSSPYQGGADLNTADEESLTPLHMAARWVVRWSGGQVAARWVVVLGSICCLYLLLLKESCTWKDMVGGEVMSPSSKPS